MTLARLVAVVYAADVAERADGTRQRILAAGAELLHGFPSWNWTALTVPTVARRADVTERTVYRHFTSERGLRDAVMDYLAQDADAVIREIELDEVAELAQRILNYTSKFPLQRRTPRDETIVATNARQRKQLVDAVERHTVDWPSEDRNLAAAMLDVLWSVASYERLVADWELSPDDAITATTWAIRLVEEAIRSGRRPGKDPAADSTG